MRAFAHRYGSSAFTLAVVVFMIAVVWTANGFSSQARFFPRAIGIPALFLALIQLTMEVVRARRLPADGSGAFDEEIVDLGPGIVERSRQMSVELRAELESRLDQEPDSRVRQDLGILIKAIDDSITSSDLEHELMLPYFNINQTVFFGIRGILDPQNSRDRYPAAIARIEKYAGLAPDTPSLAELAKDRTRERFEVDGLI